MKHYMCLLFTRNFLYLNILLTYSTAPSDVSEILNQSLLVILESIFYNFLRTKCHVLTTSIVRTRSGLSLILLVESTSAPGQLHLKNECLFSVPLNKVLITMTNSEYKYVTNNALPGENKGGPIFGEYGGPILGVCKILFSIHRWESNPRP